MPQRILIVGRLQERVDDLVEQLRPHGLAVTGTADFEQAVASVAAGEVDAVAIGAGLDDDVRLPLAERLRAASGAVEVHVKPDRAGGPGAMVPFVLGIAAGTSRTPDS